MNYLKLGKLHSNIWWEHDKKQFKKLEKTAFLFLIELNFKTTQSKLAAKYIKESYEEYDKAIKNKKFSKMEKKHKQIMATLNFNKNQGVNYSNWWISFSERKNLEVAKNLIKYHLEFFKGIKKIIALIASIIIILAGLFGHNKRNKKISDLLLSIYWFFILLNGKNKFIIY